jgi:integrase
MADEEHVLRSIWGSVRPYTRHGKGCEYKDDPDYNQCHCSKWVYIHPKSGERQRISLETPSWAEAVDKATEILQAMNPEIAQARDLRKKAEKSKMPIMEAIQKWLDRTETEFGKASAILAHYRSTFGWVDGNGMPRGVFLRYVVRWNAEHPDDKIINIQQITPLWLQTFRDTGFYTKGSDATRHQRWGTVRSFFRFLHDLGILPSNPASQIRRPSQSGNFANTPFTDEQYDAILKQAMRYVDSRERSWEKDVYCQRTTAFLELLRRTGMDLGDAVLFRPEDIHTESVDDVTVPVLRYMRQKTKIEAVIPLREEHAKLFLSVPTVVKGVPGAPFRYSGNLQASDAHNWGRRISTLIRLAKIRRVALIGRDGRPALDAHGNQITKAPNVKMLRHTFAVGELLAGVPIEAVAKEMGHVDTKMLRTRYAPWVPERDRAHIMTVLRSRA